MKGFKIVFIFLIIFIISGCANVEYNLTINDKLQVKEQVNFLLDNAGILEKNDSIDLFFSETIKSYKNFNELSNYQFNYRINEYDSIVTVEKNFLSLNDYITSPFLNQAFNDAEIITNNNYTSLEIKEFNHDNIYYSHEPDFNFGDINIRIKFYNNIVENNADYYDEKTNTLEWRITNQDMDKTIYFMIDNSKRYDIIIIDYVMDNLITVISLSILIVSMVTISSFLYIRNKSNNKI